MVSCSRTDTLQVYTIAGLALTDEIYLLGEDPRALAINTTGTDRVFLLTSDDALPPLPPASDDVDPRWASYEFEPGASNPAVRFAEWVAEVRRSNTQGTRLIVLSFEITLH